MNFLYKIITTMNTYNIRVLLEFHIKLYSILNRFHNIYFKQLTIFGPHSYNFLLSALQYFTKEYFVYYC